MTRPYGNRELPYAGPLRRHVSPKGTKRPPLLSVNHPALVEGRTLFPSTVTAVADSPRLLVGGHKSRKIGKRIIKGRWAGMPVYTLTLEERATCPKSCLQWAGCYGNSMNWARRHRAGPDLETMLAREVASLARKHRRGFAVRLHVLGDFYSVGYVRLWATLLALHPQLHIFGFTARDPMGEIGAEVIAMLDLDRCWIRFSGYDADGLGALVIRNARESRSVVCPAQTGKTECCSTCGLCWSMDRTIEFLAH
jgi:hypothetical protein